MVSNAVSIHYPKGSLPGAISDTNCFRLSFLEPEAKAYVLILYSTAQSWEAGVRARGSEAEKKGKLISGALLS